MTSDSPHTDTGQGEGLKPKTVAAHWIPVGHDIAEQDLSPLQALSGSIIHSDDQRRRAGQEFADEALSDAASFVEIGGSGVHAIAQGSVEALWESPFAYVSAAAAVYLLTQIHKEGGNQEGKLKRALELLDEYMKTKNSAVLHKAGLELEQVPDVQLNKETHARTLNLLKVYEIGDRVASTPPTTAKGIADKLAAFGHGAKHALAQTFANAYWRNPRHIGDIFMSSVRAAAVTVRLAHLKVTGSNEIRQDHKRGLWANYRAKTPDAENKPIDLSDVVIVGMEEANAETLDPQVLEESLHIDEQYQQLTKERTKFLRLACIQGLFIGASIGQGIYNGLKGDGGWAFVNFSSASAASGPFKFFADMFVAKDALLRTHRAEMGHKIATLAGQSGAYSRKKDGQTDKTTSADHDEESHLYDSEDFGRGENLHEDPGSDRDAHPEP